MLILASKSPRRTEIMRLMGLNFTICPAKDEKNPDGDVSPDEYVRLSALYKAEAVATGYTPEDTVIGADTIVWLDGRVIGKPADEEDAFTILKSMSGRKHTVYTGYAIIKGDRKITGFEQTDVWFRELSDSEIRAYIKTGEPMDKAGAYGMQGRASVFVSRIEGDYFNIIGLPACKLYQELMKI